MNNVSLVGRLTTDVELKEGLSGTAYTTVTVAVDRVPKDKGADFIRVKVFGKAAGALANYCKKGALIGVTGRIETGSYENNSGGKTYTTEVIASNIDFLSWEHTNGATPKNNTEDVQEDNYETIDEGFPW